MRPNQTSFVRQVVRVEVGGKHVAFDARDVREVIGALEITPIPGGPRGLVGVLPYGGRAIAVLDLAAFLADASSSGSRSRTVLLATDTATLAVPIDRVHEPCSVDDERTAHAARIAFARLEVDVSGSTLPLFDLVEFVQTFEAAT